MSSRWVSNLRPPMLSHVTLSYNSHRSEIGNLKNAFEDMYCKGTKIKINFNDPPMFILSVGAIYRLLELDSSLTRSSFSNSWGQLIKTATSG